MDTMGPAPTSPGTSPGEPSPSGSTPRAASVLCTTTPEVATDDDGRVFVSGTMYHDGLNQNAWGMTEAGAKAIADSLVGMDFTASHPPLRGDRYDRAIAEGQGMPIGRVVDTAVTTAEEAMLDGGEYVADYSAEILDPVYKSRFDAGLRTGGQYGVSVGIYADPADAVCSACGDQMADCGHDRYDEVSDEASDGDAQIAGPLYPDGEGDHLASVYLPAYDHTTATVTGTDATSDAQAQAASQGPGVGAIPHAAAVLGAPFDHHDGAPAPAQASAAGETTATRVTAPSETPAGAAAVAPTVTVTAPTGRTPPARSVPADADATPRVAVAPMAADADDGSTDRDRDADGPSVTLPTAQDVLTTIPTPNQTTIPNSNPE